MDGKGLGPGVEHTVLGTTVRVQMMRSLIIEKYQATPRTIDMLDSSRPVLHQVLFILSQVGW